MKEDDNKPIHHPHNNLFEKAFSNPAVTWDFLQSRLEPSVLEKIDATTLQLESGSFVDEDLKKSYSDLVMSARIAGKHSYIYFLIEHQTENEKYMMLRLLEYNTKLMRRHIEQEGGKLPTIINFVLYAGKQRYTREKNILEAFEDPVAFSSLLKRDVVIELPQEEDSKIIKDKKAALLELVLKYRSIVDALNAIENLGFDLALFVAEMHYWENALYYALKVGDDTPQAILNKISILDRTKQQATMTTLQRLRNEGIKLGEQKGIKLGKREGAKTREIQIAQGMLTKGMEAKLIQELTGLSTKELNRLKAEL